MELFEEGDGSNGVEHEDGELNYGVRYFGLLFHPYQYGNPKSHTIPKRGLRQGDPLSPYLFLLCTKGLISLLNKTAHNNTILGIIMSRVAPTLNHLLFVDDNMIFCKANAETTRNVQEIFLESKLAFGQRINTKKTTMVFSRNTPFNSRQELMSMWVNGTLQQFEEYLGLPLVIGRAKRKTFAAIKDKVW